jgi:hypothetical protein
MTTINVRNQQGSGCPDCPCPFVRVKYESTLAMLNPDLASEWHSEKNSDLHPKEVRPKSKRSIWLQCSRGHEWLATIAERTVGHCCPYCYGRYATKTNNLASKQPELIAEWDWEKNIGLNPSEITPKVNKKVWCFCIKGHSWQAIIYNRSNNKSGCLACARENSRKYSIEDIKAITNKFARKCLSKKYTNSKIKLKFCCKEGHIWETRADNILYSKKWCPVCATGDHLNLRLWP